jgi:hypothetical protein
MPEQTTAIASETTTEQHWDRRPALTLLAVTSPGTPGRSGSS